MDQTQTAPRRKRDENSDGCLRWLVRRLLTKLDGSDYRARYLRLAEQFALSDIIGLKGRFRSARGVWRACVITGIVVRQYSGDYLIIDYTTEDGELIEGAEIPRICFHPLRTS